MEKPFKLPRVVAIALPVIATIGFLIACTVLQPQPEATKTPACRPLPESFTESDLIGTWVANYGGRPIKDMLVIREDYTYKQIFTDIPPDQTSRDEWQDRSFESDWKRWWIEYRPSGYIRLHMEGMRKCDNTDEMCARSGGGVSPDYLLTADVCEDEIITMPDEVVLTVAGYPVPVPRGIVLRNYLKRHFEPACGTIT
jgi:hypothetical protein